ncbi:MAG TPA: DR2241 family protein, partial [Verrucomicrobiae bacterium]|nr:DR2241 family protein [Verrucomicrobiae bacterium]
AQMGDEFIFGQVLIQRAGEGFRLRHVDDRERHDFTTAKDLRQTAQFTQSGAFRPLKSAPNLSRGWRADLQNAEELGLALNVLYPGAVADWFAVRSGSARPTNYREFTARQTGMYRLTAMLSDALAAEATQACCDQKFCLKRRLWTVPALAIDDPKSKSAIPCLEPCAVMLEFARKVMRMEQETMDKSESETTVAALEHAINHPPADLREADFAHPLNPRRVELLLNRLKSGMVNKR